MSEYTNEQLIVMARKIGLKPITAEVYHEYQGYTDEGELCELQLEAYIHDPAISGRFACWRKIECASRGRAVVHLGVGNGTETVKPEYLVFIPKEIETITDHILPQSLLNGPETSSNHRIIPLNESYKTPKKSNQSNRSRRKRH